MALVSQNINFFDYEKTHKFFSIYRSKLGSEPLGNKFFNIYDYIFNMKLTVNNNIYPLITNINYNTIFDNYKIIKLVNTPIKFEKIKLINNQKIGFNITVRHINDCKEITVLNYEKFFVLPIKSFKNLDNENIKFCINGNNLKLYYDFDKEFYFNSVEIILNYRRIKDIFIPKLGENINNPLFSINEWSVEISINNKIIDKNNYDITDISCYSEFYKKKIYLFISLINFEKKLNGYKLNENDILSYSIFINYYGNKIRVKKFSNIEIGKILISKINSLKVKDTFMNFAEVKFKNNLYFVSYMLKPEIINLVNYNIKNSNFNEIATIENNKNNYCNIFQYIKCYLSTKNLLNILENQNKYHNI